MNNHTPDSTSISLALELLTEHGMDRIGEAVQILINEAMQIERSAFLKAAPHERTSERRGYANGFRAKHLKSKLGELQLEVPRVRGLEEDDEAFYPSALERGVRSERALKLAVAEMYVQGVSTRKVAKITKQLCGLEISSSQVSRAAKRLDVEISAWQNRPLGEFAYLILDARYEKVRHGGSVIDCAVLIAVGINTDGKRVVLGVSDAMSEAEVHWRDFLQALSKRGLHGIRCVVSDAHTGLKAARRSVFPSVPWQRCQFHLQQNAQAYVPKVAMRKEVAADIRGVLTAPNRTEAERLLGMCVDKYKKSAPKLSAWMEQALPEGLTVFDLPPAHRRRMRTSNLLERLNREIKRRTRVASLFPNTESVNRLVSAIVMEISEEWETGRIYLNTNIE